MEIPNELKLLYNHWGQHTLLSNLNPKDSKIDINLLNKTIIFSSKRMIIWEKKFKNLSQPYTKDKILSQYRFCNIYRELDKQTIQIHALLNKYRNNFPLWLLNVAFSRFVCNPVTISKVGLLNFDIENNKNIFSKLTLLPSPKYGSAYIFPVSLIMKSDFNTRERFFCFYLPKVIQKVASEISKFNNIGVCDALEVVLPTFGYNFKFHWTEILIDVAYQFPQFINLYDKFPIGPGSEPTMKRFSDSKKLEDICLDIMNKQPFSNFEYLTYNSKKIYLSAENIEGIGCEFRKYTNLNKGNGRKRKYTQIKLLPQLG